MIIDGCLKVIKQELSKLVIIVRGEYGVGKSQLVKKSLEKLFKREELQPKIDDHVLVLINQLNPIDRTLKLNGLRGILK